MPHCKINPQSLVMYSHKGLCKRCVFKAITRGLHLSYVISHNLRTMIQVGRTSISRCKMGSLYTFWEARLLSMIQHLIGKNTGVESACLLIYMVVLQIQMSKWHESAHGLVRKPGHLVCCIILFTNVLQIQL
jgi:hypothetical protein